MVGPTIDNDLYDFQTLGAERQVAEEVGRLLANVEVQLTKWVPDALRKAYTSGLSDGYAQGVHDRHKEES